MVLINCSDVGCGDQKWAMRAERDTIGRGPKAKACGGTMAEFVDNHSGHFRSRVVTRGVSLE